MKILHLSNHIQRIGNGIVNVEMDLACLQAQMGAEVAVASAGGDYEALLESYGVRHFRLDQRRTLGNLLQAAHRYCEIIHQFRPEIVHAHMMTGMVLAKFLRRKHPYGLVSTVHNEFQRSAVLMGLADRVIAVSQAVSRSMQQRGVPSAKLRVVFNGAIQSPRTRPIVDYDPVPLQRPAITTVAGLYHRKGIADVIAAFDRIAEHFPQVHLYLVGDGPDRSQLEAQARTLACRDRIHFEGFQPEPQRYLLATDIFVLASHKESAGLVIQEAREAGCAIVAADVDGIPEGLEAGRAGLLFEVKNPAALAQALTQLLQFPETLKMWQRRSQQNLDWLKVDRMHQETIAIYRELLE